MGLNIVVQDIIRDGITRVSTILHWGELICFLKEVTKPKVSYYYLGSNSYHFQDPIFGNKFLSLSGSHNRVFRERLEWVGEPGKTHRRNQRNPVRIRTKKFNKSGREGQYNQKVWSDIYWLFYWNNRKMVSYRKDERLFFFLKDAFENTKDFSENNKITWQNSPIFINNYW